MRVHLRGLLVDQQVLEVECICFCNLLNYNILFDRMPDHILLITYLILRPPGKSYVLPLGAQSSLLSRVFDTGAPAVTDRPVKF